MRWEKAARLQADAKLVAPPAPTLAAPAGRSALAMGPEAAATVNLPQAVRFLGEALGVPSDLIRKELPGLSQVVPLAPEELPQEEPILEGEEHV